MESFMAHQQNQGVTEKSVAPFLLRQYSPTIATPSVLFSWRIISPPEGGPSWPSWAGSRGNSEDVPPEQFELLLLHLRLPLPRQPLRFGNLGGGHLGGGNIHVPFGDTLYTLSNR